MDTAVRWSLVMVVVLELYLIRLNTKKTIRLTVETLHLHLTYLLAAWKRRTLQIGQFYFWKTYQQMMMLVVFNIRNTGLVVEETSLVPPSADRNFQASCLFQSFATRQRRRERRSRAGQSLDADLRHKVGARTIHDALGRQFCRRRVRQRQSKGILRRSVRLPSAGSHFHRKSDSSRTEEPRLLTDSICAVSEI